MNRVHITAIAFAALAAAQDWNQWRGPNRDGVAAEDAIPAALPEKVGPPVWQVTVGEGHSSPVLAGDRVYAFARRGEKEFLACYSLTSGKVLWETGYAAPYRVNSAAQRHGPGPKATPTVAGGAVYTLGISGILSSFDAATGKLRWQKEFGSRYPSTSPLYGAASSPLVAGDRVIAAVGGHGKGALVALAAANGSPQWIWDADGPAYASPVMWNVQGTGQVVTQSQNYVLGVSPESGQLLWKIPFTTSYDQNAVTPVPAGEMLIYGGLANGITAIRVTRKGNAWETQKAWHTDEQSLYMNSPVLHGNLLFGFSHRNRGQYFCLDARTGKTLWTGPPRAGENAAIVRAGDRLILLNTEAELVIAKASAGGLELIRKFMAADSPTWAHPAPAGGRILIKDATTLRCLRIGS
jgi:outer membrane protein assembly factor BamB